MAIESHDLESDHDTFSSGQTHGTDRASLGELKKDFTDVQRDLGKMKSHAIDYASSAAGTAAATAKHGAEAAMDAAKKASDHAKQAHTEMCNFVRQRPMVSVLLAIGVGAIVTRVLSSRR